MTLVVVRNMSSIRSIPTTIAIPVAAGAPRPKAFKTMRVVTSELPGMPTPATAAAVAVTRIVRISCMPMGSPYTCKMNMAVTAL